MRRYLVILGLSAAAGTAFVAGCLLPGGSKVPREVARALDGPDRDVTEPYTFTLYSLEPTAPGAAPAGAETFHGCVVLGKTEVRDAVARRKLVAAFNRGVGDHDGSVAACFLPHHGVSVQQGKHAVDLVVCFKCAQVKVYVDGAESETILISDSPRAVFNDVLDRARVPVSKDGH